MTTNIAHRLAQELAAMPADQRHTAHQSLVVMRDQAIANATADLDLAQLITQTLNYAQGATP